MRPFLAEGPHVRLDTPNRFTGRRPPVLLIQPEQFSCPRCGPTNAVAQPITAGALTNPLAGFCHRCEHSYQFTVGSPNTTTTGTANVQGATALTAASGTSFSTVGAFVVIDSTRADSGAGNRDGQARPGRPRRFPSRTPRCGSPTRRARPCRRPRWGLSAR